MGSTLLLLAGGELGSSSLQRLHKTAAISITEAKQDREAADSTRGQRWTAIGLSGFSTFDPEEMEGRRRNTVGKKTGESGLWCFRRWTETPALAQRT